MHREPTAQPPRLWKLILVLVLDSLLPDLPATLTHIDKRRVQFLINLRRRLTVTMPPMIITRPSTRPTCTPRRLATGEWRRLTLGRPPRLLQLALQQLHPRLQPLVLSQQTRHLAPQPVVLRHQQRAPRHQLRKLVYRLGRENLNL
jgi:hypothetical protein